MGRQHPTNPNIDGSEWKSFSFMREMRTLLFLHVLDLVSDFFKGHYGTDSVVCMAVQKIGYQDQPEAELPIR
jgi:hypothetical protein